MSMNTIPEHIYEFGLSYLVTWQAHSQSNAGSNGSNRLMPRHQLLADVPKRMHAVATLPSTITRC